jgi:hypothetical protein
MAKGIKKAKKERTGPKKPLTAFMYFNMDQRTKLVSENPGIAFGEVGKKLGAMWKELKDDQKAPYAAKAALDKKRFEDELAASKSTAETVVAAETPAVEVA